MFNKYYSSASNTITTLGDQRFAALSWALDVVGSECSLEGEGSAAGRGRSCLAMVVGWAWGRLDGGERKGVSRQ